MDRVTKWVTPNPIKHISSLSEVGQAQPATFPGTTHEKFLGKLSPTADISGPLDQSGKKQLIRAKLFFED